MRYHYQIAAVFALTIVVGGCDSQDPVAGIETVSVEDERKDE